LVTASKGVLLLLTAVGLLRLTERRTLAQLAPFDLVTMVSIGAIVGRTVTARDTSFLTGAVALLAVVLTHQAIGWLRLRPRLRQLIDRPVTRLVDDGKVLSRALRRHGLTEADLYQTLRERGVANVSDVRYVFYETRGQFSVVGWDAPIHTQPVASALTEAPPAPTDRG
jgi:uncharacterized membrane protein YcaP (DUF421 family)